MFTDEGGDGLGLCQISRFLYRGAVRAIGQPGLVQGESAWIGHVQQRRPALLVDGDGVNFRRVEQSLQAGDFDRHEIFRREADRVGIVHAAQTESVELAGDECDFLSVVVEQINIARCEQFGQKLHATGRFVAKERLRAEYGEGFVETGGIEFAQDAGNHARYARKAAR